MMKEGLTDSEWKPTGPQQIATTDSLTFLLDVSGVETAFFEVREIE